MEQVLILVSLPKQSLLLHSFQIPRRNFSEVHTAKQPLRTCKSLSCGDSV
jgi:hypothetical protein